MRFVLLIVAAVIAVVAGISALKLTGGQQSETPQQSPLEQLQSSAKVNTVDVMVAREFIPVGTVIQEKMIARQPWPSHLVLENFIVAGDNDKSVVGKVARSTFLSYEPLLKTRISDPNDPSFLASTLPKGMRAMTLATDVVSGVAGYIFPGDRVDVIVTHNVPKEAELMHATANSAAVASSNKPAYAEVLVPNARVLAINIRRVETTEVRPENPSPSSITIEVPEQVAQEVRLAEKLGTLSLTLRSLKDIEDNTKPPPPTTIEDLTHADMVSNGIGVKLIRGVKSDDGASGGPVGMVKGTEMNLAVEPTASVSDEDLIGEQNP